MKTKILSKNLSVAGTVVLLCLGGKPSGLAATTNVFVGAGGTFTFSPALVSIKVGDQIVWTWQGNFHSTTSGTNGTASTDPNSWNSTVFSAPHSFTNTFNSPGSFAFFCSVHWSSHQMTGAVFVASSILSPTISITNPVPGSVFAEPANVTIQASASESGGSITNVQFLVGPSVLANVATAPFSATTNNLSLGGYTLSAIASDANGATATSSVPINVVTPVAVSLASSVVTAGTNFQFSYLVNTGLSYVVQRSTILSPPNWISLATNVAASNPVVFVDRSATNTPAFYRVGRMPNP